MDRSWYIITGCLAHASLRGQFMTNLRFFSLRACADAKWAAKCDQIQGTRSLTSSGSPTPLPRSIRPGRSDDESLACKAPRAVSPVIPEVSTRTVNARLYCRYQYRFPDLPTRISWHRMSGHLGWQHSNTRRPRNLVIPRFASMYLDDFGSECSRSLSSFAVAWRG